MSAEGFANAAIVALLVAGIAQFRTPRGARRGNHAAALALIAAVCLVVAQHGVTRPWIVGASTALGAALGIAVAYRARMTSIPSVVAFQHGMGGVAAVVVSAIELTEGGATLSTTGRVSGLFGLVLGAATFSASMLAAARLANKIGQRPTTLRAHNTWLLLLLVIALVPMQQWDVGAVDAGAVIIAATIFGLLFAGHDAGSIQRSTVRFEDVNGPKGGVDKLCRIKLVLTGRPTMLAEKRAATPGRAFASAVQSISVAIARDHERQIGRRLASVRSRKRSPTNWRRKKTTSM